MRNCPSCGVQNADFSTKCEACGRDLNSIAGQTTTYRHIDDHLVQAILVTIFCCLPLGIPGIVYAAQVKSLLRSGDTGGALAASNDAKFWINLSFWSGLIAVILTVLVKACTR